MRELFRKAEGYSYYTYNKYSKKNNLARAAARAEERRTGIRVKPILYPSMYDTASRIIIAIDTSGSIYCDSASMKFAASEIMRLTGELGRHKGSVIDVLCCDTEITSHKRLKAGTGEFRDFIDEIENKDVAMTGGGGTDLLPVWDFAMDKNRELSPGDRIDRMSPNGLIVVTDTQTWNADKIADLYKTAECRIPTVILVPS